MGAVVALCYMGVYLAGWSTVRGVERRVPRPTGWGIGLWCVVAVPSVLQFAVPGMLEAGQRDPSAIADGEWWRLFTSMGLQDGGLLGTAFNLVTLAITVALVGAVLRGPLMVATFVIGGLIGNVLTIVILDGTGAGNSMATMFLVAVAAVVVWFRRGHHREPPMLALAAIAVVLLVLRDQHGFATTAGLLTGLATTLKPQPATSRHR
jgi:hypothetical protein